MLTRFRTNRINGIARSEGLLGRMRLILDFLLDLCSETEVSEARMCEAPDDHLVFPAFKHCVHVQFKLKTDLMKGYESLYSIALRLADAAVLCHK